MTSPLPIVAAITGAPVRVSRRALLARGSASGLAFIGFRPRWPWPTAPAPVVTVTAPMLAPDDCTVTITIRMTVSVRVTIAHLTRGVGYEVRGDILEADDPDGDADFCGSLVPQAIASSHQGSQTLLLKGRMKAVDLGLVKGVGPGSDETFSPDLVELFARVWLWNLTTEKQEGPWTSPVRTAVARDAAAWRLAEPRLGS